MGPPVISKELIQAPLNVDILLVLLSHTYICLPGGVSASSLVSRLTIPVMNVRTA